MDTKASWYLYDPQDIWIAEVVDEHYARTIVDALNYCELDEPEAKK